MQRYLIASIWVIAVGTILLLCGLIIGGTGTFDIGNWFSSSHSLVDNVAIGAVWGGIVLFIFGLFGIATSFLKGRPDKQEEKVTPVAQP